jgi:hypothetical protein
VANDPVVEMKKLGRCYCCRKRCPPGSNCSCPPCFDFVFVLRVCGPELGNVRIRATSVWISEAWGAYETIAEFTDNIGTDCRLYRVGYDAVNFCTNALGHTTGIQNCDVPAPRIVDVALDSDTFTLTYREDCGPIQFTISASNSGASKIRWSVYQQCQMVPPDVFFPSLHDCCYIDGGEGNVFTIDVSECCPCLAICDTCDSYADTFTFTFADRTAAGITDDPCGDERTYISQYPLGDPETDDLFGVFTLTKIPGCPIWQSEDNGAGSAYWTLFTNEHPTASNGFRGACFYAYHPVINPHTCRADTVDGIIGNKTCEGCGCGPQNLFLDITEDWDCQTGIADFTEPNSESIIIDSDCVSTFINCSGGGPTTDPRVWFKLVPGSTTDCETPLSQMRTPVISQEVSRISLDCVHLGGELYEKDGQKWLECKKGYGPQSSTSGTCGDGLCEAYCRLPSDVDVTADPG